MIEPMVAPFAAGSAATFGAKAAARERAPSELPHSHDGRLNHQGYPQ